MITAKCFYNCTKDNSQKKSNNSVNEIVSSTSIQKQLKH